MNKRNLHFLYHGGYVLYSSPNVFFLASSNKSFSMICSYRGWHASITKIDWQKLTINSFHFVMLTPWMDLQFYWATCSEITFLTLKLLSLHSLHSRINLFILLHILSANTDSSDTTITSDFQQHLQLKTIQSHSQPQVFQPCKWSQTFQPS